MQVLHVFSENTEEDRAAHLENWFGFPEAGFGWDRNDRKIVCYCGGRLIPLKRNHKDGSDILVGAVWHLETWREGLILDEVDDDE